MGKNKNKDGPRFAKKTAKAEAAENPEPEPKPDFTGLRPPGSPHHPLHEAGDKAAAIHQMEAAAAKAEDRAAKDAAEPDVEEEEDSESGDPSLDEMAQKFLSNFQFREQLQTEEQKALINKRLEDSPIDLSQIYTEGQFTQVVPIIPEKFVPEFRSLTPEEDIQLKAMMSKEPEDMSIRYMQDKYAMYSLVCGIRSLNGNPFPSHFTNAGGWNEAGFKEKVQTIMRMPVPAVWSLMVHYQWFDERCRGVFKIEDLKNG